MHVLFVCTGNTCRSPLAEVLLKAALDKAGIRDIVVSSAGISAMPGSPASEGSRAVLQPPEDLSAHMARPVSPDLLCRADLILTMTSSHKDILLDLYPDSEGKVYTLAEYAWGCNKDILDPFGGDFATYSAVRAEIESAVEEVVEKIAGDDSLKIALASDHGGYRLKEELKEVVRGLGHEFEDYGCHSEESVDYPDFAASAARAVAVRECDCGIIVCGTGIGVAIAANKIKGIRAANCSDTFSARMAREHNDANILTLGQRVVGSGLAKAIVEAYLGSSFEGERHRRRLDKIAALEEDFRS